MKKILLTGHSGFLGKRIKECLIKEQLLTLGRHDSDYICNLELDVPKFYHNFDLIIHSAGKAHSVPKNLQQKQEFYQVNTKGTLNLLSGLETLSERPKAFVFISTVAVYGLETGDRINEQTPLRAIDPYGHSKILAEKEIIKWGEKNNVKISILRLPLVVGANPLGNLKTMIDGIKKGVYFNIGEGQARKSMVLAEDVAKFIPMVANIGGIYNLTDGYHPSFYELSNYISSQLGKKKVYSIPITVAFYISKLGDLLGNLSPINTYKYNKIVSNLTFDDSLARKNAHWESSSVLKGFKIS